MQSSTLDAPKVCDTCGKHVSETHAHHILPRHLGGTDLPSNLADVCLDCHALIHDRGAFAHSQIVREGLERAKDRGVKLGAPVKVTPENTARMRTLRAMGAPFKFIAAEVGVSVGTVHKVCKAS